MKKQHRRRFNRLLASYFTMIELMVVIGIILILAALLIPTLTSSKNSAKSTFCLNNVKNLTLAAFQYSQEWDAFCAWGSDYKGLNLNRWHGRCDVDDVDDSNTAPYDSDDGPLYPYLKTKFIECPVLKDTVDISHPSVERGGGGYGYNLYIGSRAYFVDNSDSEEAYKSGILTKNLKHPDTTVMFADTAMVLDSDGYPSSETSLSGELGEYSICKAPFSVNGMKTQTGEGREVPSIHFRHNKVSNIGWSDGHVDSAVMEWTLNSGWEKRFLGFWGDKDDNSLFDPL